MDKSADEENSSGSEVEFDPPSKCISTTRFQVDDLTASGIDEPKREEFVKKCRRRRDIKKLLLSEGASIFDKLPSGELLLYAALRERCFVPLGVAIARMSPNFRDPARKADVLVFHAACAISIHSVVNKFLKQGFDPNTPLSLDLKEYSGLRPVELAIKNNYFELFVILLQNKVDLSIKNVDGLTPLHQIYYSNRLECRELWITEAFTYCRYSKKIIDCEDKYGVSHFHLCCMTTRVDLVKNAIDDGFDVSRPVSSECLVCPHFTPLLFAVDNRRVETIELLLKSGANPNSQSGEGMTPLRLAFANLLMSQRSMFTSRGYTDVIKTLLKYNADPCIPDRSGRTFVHECFCKLKVPEALHQIYPELLKVDWGSVNHTDEQGLSLLHLACMSKDTTTVKNFLNSGASIDGRVSSGKLKGYTALHFACLQNRHKIIKLLLKRKANVNAQHAKGYTPLHISSVKCDSNVILQILLDHNADPTVPAGEKGRTPMHDLFYCSNSLREFQFVDMSILSTRWWRWPENPADADGLSFFHIACATNNLDQVRKFLDAGVDIHSCPTSGAYDGFTALHFAAMYNRREVVRTLLERSARVNAKAGESEMMPLHLACQFKYWKFNDQIESPGVSLDACRSDELDIIQLLLSHGAEVNGRDSSGITPLMYACFIYNYKAVRNSDWRRDPTRNVSSLGERWLSEYIIRLDEIVRILVSHKANVDARTVRQCTVLHVISVHSVPEYAPEELIKNLVNLGVDVNAVDVDGLTPLHMAVKLKRRELVKVLLKHRANPNVRCNLAKTSMHYVVEGIIADYKSKCPSTYVEILEALLASGGDANVRFQGGRTLLHSAVDAGNYFLTKELLDSGADVNIKDSLSKCSIHYVFNVPISDHGFLLFLELFTCHAVWLEALLLPPSREVQECLRQLHILVDADGRRRTNLNFDHPTVMYAKCCSELDVMKNTWIDRFTTLRDILRKDPHELAKHVQNKKLIKIVDVSIEKFPCYGFLLQLQFNRGAARRNVEEFAEAALRKLLNMADLPSPCCHLIMKHLTDEEVDALIKSAPAKRP